MPESFSRRERIKRVVEGRAVDRLPVSFWRHFYVEETSAEALARRLIDWHRRFDFDFLKINVRAQYHTEGWGNRYQYAGREHVKPVLTSAAVREPRDFAALAVLDPWAWPLGEMLQVTQGLRAGLGPDEILIMTVFNPLSVAGELAGSMGSLAAAMRDAPSALHHGLRTIAQTFRDFASAALEQGADGLFFATTQTASADHLTSEQYEEFGRPYDLKVLEGAGAAFLNILHVCGPHAFVRQLADYPVQALHWDAHDATNPTLPELGEADSHKALIAGLPREPFALQGGATSLLQDLSALQRSMDSRPFMVGAACTLPTETLDANIDALCRAVRSPAAPPS